MDKQTKGSIVIDWRWVLAAYCYMVMFHLLPTFLFAGGATDLIFVNTPMENVSGFTFNDFATVWLLAGIAVVAFIVAYRSRGFTVFEPALAGVLYAFTTTLGFRSFVSAHVRERGTLVAVFWLLIVIVLSVASAWIGEVMQQRKTG